MGAGRGRAPGPDRRRRPRRPVSARQPRPALLRHHGARPRLRAVPPPGARLPGPLRRRHLARRSPRAATATTSSAPRSAPRITTSASRRSPTSGRCTPASPPRTCTSSACAPTGPAWWCRRSSSPRSRSGARSSTRGPADSEIARWIAEHDLGLHLTDDNVDDVAERLHAPHRRSGGARALARQRASPSIAGSGRRRSRTIAGNALLRRARRRPRRLTGRLRRVGLECPHARARPARSPSRPGRPPPAATCRSRPRRATSIGARGRSTPSGRRRSSAISPAATAARAPAGSAPTSCPPPSRSISCARWPTSACWRSA